MKKICSTCKIAKDLKCFHKNNSHSQKKSSKCIQCTLEYSINRYLKDQEGVRRRVSDRVKLLISKGMCACCGENSIYEKSAQYCEKCYLAKAKIRKEKNMAERVKAFEHYGGQKCTCCGETQFHFLTFDHINNDGNVDRKMKGYSHFSHWALSHGYPDNIQILCWNCNMGKRNNGGFCPHKTGDII